MFLNARHCRLARRLPRRRRLYYRNNKKKNKNTTKLHDITYVHTRVYRFSRVRRVTTTMDRAARVPSRRVQNIRVCIGIHTRCVPCAYYNISSERARRQPVIILITELPRDLGPADRTLSVYVVTRSSHRTYSNIVSRTLRRF